MSLTSDAYELLEVLHHIVACLNDYAINKQNEYVWRLADSIRNLVKDYEKSITVDKSHTLAQEILSAFVEPMHQIIGAASHMPIFSEDDNSLSKYLRLYTIFRQSQYSEEQLE